MPMHVHPVLRAHGEALESAGLAAALDSAGVTIRKAAELAGTVVKVVPVAWSYNWRGSVYTAT